MKLKTRRRPGVRVEMLPLIDIVFLLLIFFIHAMMSMTVHKGVPVSLPESDAAAVAREPHLSVTARVDGTLFVNRIRVEQEVLAQHLRHQAGDNKAASVYLFADRNLPCQKLFVVLDAIKAAGLHAVSLQARTPDESGGDGV